MDKPAIQQVRHVAVRAPRGYGGPTGDTQRSRKNLATGGQSRKPAHLLFAGRSPRGSGGTCGYIIASSQSFAEYGDLSGLAAYSNALPYPPFGGAQSV